MWSANENIARLWHNCRMMTTTTDIFCRLAIFKHSENRSRKERISLGANSNLAVLIFSKCPHEGFLVNNLLRDNSDVFWLVFRLHWWPLSRFKACIDFWWAVRLRARLIFYKTCILVSLVILFIWRPCKTDMLHMPHGPRLDLRLHHAGMVRDSIVRITRSEMMGGLGCKIWSNRLMVSIWRSWERCLAQVFHVFYESSPWVNVLLLLLRKALAQINVCFVCGAKIVHFSTVTNIGGLAVLIIVCFCMHRSSYCSVIADVVFGTTASSGRRCPRLCSVCLITW